MSERMFLWGLIWINVVACVVVVILSIWKPDLMRRFRHYANTQWDWRI